MNRRMFFAGLLGLPIAAKCLPERKPIVFRFIATLNPRELVLARYDAGMVQLIHGTVNEDQNGAWKITFT